MVALVNGENALEAWQAGALHLAGVGEAFNLVSVIERPTELVDDWFKLHDPRRIKGNVQRLSEVATTIFPFKLARRGYSRGDLFGRYMDVHNRAKKMHDGTKRSWGTYFERMISFGETKVNQIELAIGSIRSWTKNHKAALVIHTSSAETDSIKKLLGNPCLQYVELLCPDANTITLFAVYRNHDFFEKVLGNFIGLGQLLKFICDETGRNPGQLVCHSAHAYFQSSKAQLEQLAKL